MKYLKWGVTFVGLGGLLAYGAISGPRSVGRIAGDRHDLFQQVLYDADHRTLTLQFRTGPMYTYQRVEPACYDEFCQTPSRGRFFNARIRGHYPMARVDGAKRP